MKIDQNRLEAARLLVAKKLEVQALPDFIKTRWQRAFKKAAVRLTEQPYFAWQPEQLIIVSVPPEKNSEIGCRFYTATDEMCRRLDKLAYCQAFYEGFPCWHRAAFWLLSIYFSR